MMEIAFIIIYGIFAENGEHRNYLLSRDHGLYIFVATCTAFFIYSQYRVLFPDFSLPLGASARSKWGYAFSNELNELKRIKVTKIKDGQEISVQDFWDEAYEYKKGTDQQSHYKNEAITAAVYAMANGNVEIVAWLEQQGAIKHKEMNIEWARTVLGITDDDLEEHGCDCNLF